jgi:DNA-binding HxlR family transcriptional regulator
VAAPRSGPSAGALLGAAHELLAAKWTAPVVLALGGGPLRYNRLLERIPGISHRMLTATLRRLEREGLVERRELAARGTHVQYRLSPAGSGLLPILGELEGWARRHHRHQ